MNIPEPHTDAFREAAVRAAAAPAPVAAAVSDALLAAGRLHSLQVIRAAAADDLPLRHALAIVWDDFAGLEELLAEADRDAALTAARAEYEIRAADAGAVNRAASCVCGHSGSVKHADRLMDGERLPCAAPGCPCDDVEYARASV